MATPTLEFASPETPEAEKEKQVSRTSQASPALEGGSQDALERKSSALQTYAGGVTRVHPGFLQLRHLGTMRGFFFLN